MAKIQQAPADDPARNREQDLFRSRLEDMIDPKHPLVRVGEAVVARWLENPYWQHFCGEVFFQTRLPCDPSSLTRYRNHLDEAGVEELLAQTISAAQDLKAIQPRHLERVIVDTTVQEKAVAYPTDNRLLETCRRKLVEAANHHGIALRQSYARKGPKYAHWAGRYARARQFKRMRKMLNKQRTLVGRLIRDIERKAGDALQAP